MMKKQNKAAAHTNLNTTKIYTVGHKRREVDFLKNLKIGS